MGAQGDKMNGDSVLLAELLTEKLSTLDGITFKKMFGGHGIFSDGKMFGMISAKGFAFLKVDDDLRAKYEKLGSEPHSKMPYSSIPQEVLNDTELLLEWCAQSIQLTK
jgi:DNA transformation protein